jgi:hypothetical protein
MTLRVCIPTAGTGSRLGDLTTYLNKSLVTMANRPVLSHLIEQFPQEAEFVIALGHKGHLVREFLALAYPQRRFLFSEVDPFEGPGSGLGLSLLACQEHLQQPFVFISCDTLVGESIPPPAENWMGYAQAEELAPYRSLDVADGRVLAICEKGEGSRPRHRPYIGLAGIHDYRAFWTAMRSGGDGAIQSGEAHGLRALVAAGIRAHGFTWHDTGNREALARARALYREPDTPNILEKANEAIWFVAGEVIKFSDDPGFIANRVERSRKLRGFAPEVTGAQPHMYRYPKAEGRVLSEVANVPLFERLLKHCQEFWQPAVLDQDQLRGFHRCCLSFYRDKTLERVELFYRNFRRRDGVEAINGKPMPKLAALLNALEWDWLADGLPGRFHGDFHFENILWSPVAQRFTFLDWRQDFGGSLTIGDVYYDLAKLLHGLIICHELIARDHFRVDWGEQEIRYDFHRKQALVECEHYFGHWLESAGYDIRKVRVLTALVYLNIAALHHYPYGLLLFALGKSMLCREVGGDHAAD